jgi:hypothetical protein
MNDNMAAEWGRRDPFLAGDRHDRLGEWSHRDIL